MKKGSLIAFMNSYTHGISGGDACFIELAKRLKQYNKIVVTSLLGKKLCETKELKADYLVTTKEQNFKNVLFIYLNRIIKALLLRIEVCKGDILYATSDFLPDVLPAFYQKIKNKNAYWVQKIFHLIPSKRIIPYLAQKISFLFVRHFADLIIVDNSILRRDLILHGFPKEKVVVNHLGINIKYFQNLTVSSKIFYDAVFLGRLHPSKGIFDLIKIWKIIIKIKPKLKLAVIGSGDSKIIEKFKKQITNGGLQDNIVLLGHLLDDEAFSILKGSRIFVFPSHEEGWGIAICEAMACGLPVVAYDLPAYRNVFKKGIIVSPMGDFIAYVFNVIKLLNDKQLRIQLAKEAMEQSLKYDIQNTAKSEIELILNKVL